MRLAILLLVSHPVWAFCSHSGISSPLFRSNQLKPSYLKHHTKILHPVPSSLTTLRGGATNELVFASYEWCVNLGAPAALVAGAVIATLYENIREGVMEVERGDDLYTRFAKKGTGILLMSAFALQIITIFVTTVTGSMLLARDFSGLKVTSTTAMGFLQKHFEFEFLTSRICFLQGLLHWLGGVALEFSIPRKGQGKEAIKMDRFVASSLVALVMFLLSFYNIHLTFYKNYFHMVSRWFQLFIRRYFGTWRPMLILYVPMMCLSIYMGVKALVVEKDDHSVPKLQKTT